LHAQLVWPARALLVLNSSVEPQARQVASPASAKVCAGQAKHTVLLVGAQAAEMTEPGAHEAEHAEHGDCPLALQVEPAEQPATATHESNGESQKYPEAHEQLD